MKKVLIRNGKHMRPMLAVLERYGIGSIDGYNRGRWITEKDLPAIEQQMLGHRHIDVGNGVIYVQGTNQHNHVSNTDFKKLFQEVTE